MDKLLEKLAVHDWLIDVEAWALNLKKPNTKLVRIYWYSEK